MISINTNLSSLITQSNLKNATNGLNQAIERMSTGFKINHAKDNAANHSINTQLTTKIGAYQVAEDNVAMGLDMLTTASESLELISNGLSRLRALQEQASNGTYGRESLEAINSEANAIIDELERVRGTTEYNGKKLFEANQQGSIGADSGSSFINEVIRRDTSTMVKLSSLDASATQFTENVYSISTDDELAQLATMVNNGVDTTGVEFVLADDISLRDYQAGEGWIPIGMDITNSFNGSLDGNGYIISDLYINRLADNQGLFGAMQGTSTIKNLGLENVDITGGTYVGAIVGYSWIPLTLENCYVEGNVSGSNNVGGFVGYTRWTSAITDCSSSVNVSGTSSVGGFGGALTMTTFTNCVSKGKISANSDAGAFGGTFYGSVTFNNCTYYSSVNPGVTFVDLGYGGVTDGVTPPTNNSSGSDAGFGNVIFQVGIHSEDSSQISLAISFSLEGLDDLRQIGLNANTDFFAKIDNFISAVSTKQTEFGAAQNRLESALDEINIHYENLVSSRSTTRDADVAEESSSYIKMQILQQASTTLLATANQTPSIAIQLI